MKKLLKLLSIVTIGLLTIKSAAAQQITYSKDRADLHEYLKITRIDKTKIKFEILMESGGCEKFTNKGIAKLNSRNPTGRIDVDENDNSFDVAEYTGISNGISVTIKLGVQKGYTNRARFNWHNTKSEEDPCKTESESLIKSK